MLWQGFSRKGAKTQRKTLRNAAALCVFAPLREKSSGIKHFLCKAWQVRIREHTKLRLGHDGISASV
jgi:hypothetical protein